MSNVITLNGGRTIRLYQLHQELTYEGMLAGTPSAQLNNSLVEDLEDKAKSLRSWIEPYLIQPSRRDFHTTPGDMDAIRAGSSHVPEWMPAISCIGRFESFSPARDTTCMCSSLVIAWCQESFAMPIDAEILTVIKALDWTALATDCDFD